MLSSETGSHLRLTQFDKVFEGFHGIFADCAVLPDGGIKSDWISTEDLSCKM